jgi:Protein of unknown function (DUF3562)
VNEVPLYDNRNEMKLHQEAIRFISLHHLDIPEERVARLYEFVLRRYKEQARIKDFLLLLAAKRVEELLRRWNGRQGIPE